MDAFAPDQAASTPFGPLVLTHADRGLLLDVADPLQPALAAAFTLPFGVNVHAAAFDANHVYFAQEGYGLGVLDPATLQTIGRYDADLPPYLQARDMEDLSVDGGRAYLAAWGYGVLVVDLADPAQPVELGRFEFPYASAIEAHGDLVYASSTTNGGYFRIFDVADPAAPQPLGELVTSQTYDLTVRGDYAYLADGADFGDGGLRVVDVSTPGMPVLVGQDTGCPYAMGIDASADGKVHGLRNCPAGQWLQERHPNTIFVLENFGFYQALRPLASAFAKHGREDLFVEHGADFHPGGPKLGGEVVFPDVVAAELLAHELLEQHFADRFEGRIG